jgi:hypothetical protein
MSPHDARTLATVQLRTLPREQLAIGVMAAFAIVVLLPEHSGGAHPIFALQGAALALTVAFATILDEPAAETANATPPTLLVRRALMIALMLPAVAVLWGALTSLDNLSAARSEALTLQLAALVTVTLALAAMLPRGDRVAGPAVALAFLTTLMAKPTWTLPPDPGNGHWIIAWTALTAAALLALLIASRDPAWPRRHRARGARVAPD